MGRCWGPGWLPDSGAACRSEPPPGAGESGVSCSGTAAEVLVGAAGCADVALLTGGVVRDCWDGAAG